MTRGLQSKNGNWNCFDITSKGMMRLRALRDSLFSRQFMMFHSRNIKFSSSSFKRSNCLSRRWSFAFASRALLRTRNRSLCTLRMVKGGMTKSQNFLDATHAKHFSNASPSKHCLPEEEQNLQGRMLMNKNPKFDKRDCFRWEEIRLLFFARGIFHAFETKAWERDSMLRTKGNGPVSSVRKSNVTRILLDGLDERASMSRN